MPEYSSILFQCKISKSELVVNAWAVAGLGFVCGYSGIERAYAPFVVSDFCMEYDVAESPVAVTLFFALCADAEVERNLKRAMLYVEQRLRCCMNGDEEVLSKEFADFFGKLPCTDVKSVVAEIEDGCRVLLENREFCEFCELPLKFERSAEIPIWLYRVVSVLNEDMSCSTVVSQFAEWNWQWGCLLLTEEHSVTLQAPVKFIRKAADAGRFEVMFPQHGDRHCQAEYLKLLFGEQVRSYYGQIDEEMFARVIEQFGEGLG